MVGIFSRFSASKGEHRRAQSALNQREVLPPSSEATTAATLSTAISTAAHGIEVSVQFKAVEHPTEPPDNDQPVHCPLPEPSMLNDGRIWKERVSSSFQRQVDIPVMKEQTPVESDSTPAIKPRPHSNRVILSSVSAPEHNIVKLLEECNTPGI